MNPHEFESPEIEFLDEAPLERVVALSEAQVEVWLADRLGRDASLAFNESVTVRIEGRLEIDAVWRAIDQLVARHESLRATASRDGSELLIAPAGPIERSPLIDLRGRTEPEREAALAAAAAAAVATPFDLERGPLFRVTCVRLGDEAWALVLSAHHIVCDGWSWGVIARDLGALYAAELKTANPPPAAPQYSAYVEWERRESTSETMAAHERFWLERFAGAPPDSLELPTDRRRPAIRTFRSKRVDRVLPPPVVNAAKSACARAGASQFATLLAAFAILLHRLTRQDDLVIGVPAAGQAASEMPDLVGHCVNLLPIRFSIDDAEPVSSWLKRVGAQVLDAFEHQTLGYGSLLRKLSLPRDPSRLPLVNVMFNVDPGLRTTGLFPGAGVRVLGNPRVSENFELFANLVADADGIRIECQYNADLFDEASVARWLDGFESLVAAIGRGASGTVGELPLLSAQRWEEVTRLQPLPTAFDRTALMHSGFVAEAGQHPDRWAVACGEERLTYGDLDRRSIQLARTLHARGLRRGGRVGLCLERGPDMMVALLAVLRAGGTYVPLDPGFPPARLAYYAEDARLELLITASTVASAPRSWRPDASNRIIELDRDAWRTCSTEPLIEVDHAGTEDAAYVIYTSGSTGQPKGVAVPHRAVVNFLASMAGTPGLSRTDRLAAVTTLSFDIAVLELFLPLSVGAEVVIVPRDTAIDGVALAALLDASGATVLQATPGMWRTLLEVGWRAREGFRALVGGESLPADLAEALLERCGDVWNLYGPTETTIWSTAWKVEATTVAERGVAIGLPIANTTVWVLDSRLQACPVGVPGEICIGGDGVALGYLDRPELTAERFIANPFGDGRVYRTGDCGRWRNDGLLEHRGRFDFQVKVRGYRIELGEIEAALARHPDIDRTVVITREEVPGDVRIVAYVVARGTMPSDAALREHLASRLPEYMIPQHFVSLAALPLLPNGKVARKALPAPAAGASGASGATSVQPRTETERRVLAAMEASLNLPGLGVTDDFFLLGGHSLLAARLIARLNREFEVSLPLRTLFEARTAEKLAKAVGSAQASDERASTIPHVPGRRWAALTPMQERVRFVEELHPGRVVYNTPSAHRLKGPLDVARFTEALQTVVRRQPALRTSVARHPDGHGYVQAIAETLDISLPFVDLSGIPAADRESELLRQMQEIIDEPIDIYRPPLFRAALYRLEADHHAFLFTPHHLIWDGWSFDLLYDELAAAYGAILSGTSNPLPPLPVTYADFAEWHAGWMKSPEFAREFDYWKRRILDQAEPAAIRPDRPRRAGSMSGDGASEWVRIDKATTERLREIALELDATLNMLTMAVWVAMMAATADSPAIIVGVPVRCRQRAELEPIMGFFNNLLPLQIPVDRTAKMSDLVRLVRHDLLDAMSHQDVPFERLAEDPALASRMGRTGLYQVLFSFQDARGRVRQWGSLSQSTILVLQKGATEDLGLWLMEVPGGLEGGLVYNSELYTAETASAFRDRFIELAVRLSEDPHLTIDRLLEDTSTSAASKILSQRNASQALAAAPPTGPAARAAGGGTVSGELSDAERTLRSIWADLLDLSDEDVRPADNFFDLGGSSLVAMRAVERSEKAFGFAIDPRRYAYENLAQLARRPVERDKVG